MKYIVSPKNWTQEPGYRRGILLPLRNNISPRVQVQLTEILPGDTVRSHLHRKQTEFIYFLEGACDFVVNNESFVVGPAQLLIIEPGDRHSTTNNSGVTARLLTFKLDAAPGDTVWG